MKINSGLFILLLSFLAVQMAAAGRRRHHLHHHHGHRHPKSVHFKPSTDTVPFPSIPWIVPGTRGSIFFIKYLKQFWNIIRRVYEDQILYSDTN